MKLARGSTATSHGRPPERGRHAISELRTCSTVQIRSSLFPPCHSAPSPSSLLFPCVFWGSIQFQRKPRAEVSYTNPARPRPRPRPRPPSLSHCSWPTACGRSVRPLWPPTNPTWCALMTSLPECHEAEGGQMCREKKKLSAASVG